MRVSIFLTSVCLAIVLALASGCQTRRADRDFVPHLARVFVEVSDHMPPSQSVETVLPMSRTRIAVRGRPILLEEDVLQAGQIQTDLGPALVLVLTPQAGRDLMRASSSHLGRRMVLTINGVPIGARHVDRIMDEGVISFYVEIDDDEVPQLVENIQKTSQRIHSSRR